MRNKRGVSGIVVTIMLISFALIALLVVYSIVNNLLKRQTDIVTLNDKCLNVHLKPTFAECSLNSTDATCNVTIKREAGGDEIDGAKLLFYNSDGTTVSRLKSGNIAPLSVVVKDASFEDVAGEFTKVETYAYFKDSTGTEQFCSEGNSYVFD